MSTETTIQPIPIASGIGSLQEVLAPGRVPWPVRFAELARRHGPIFALPSGNHRAIVLSSHALIDEVCDDRRFDKVLYGGRRVLRKLGGDGLFTARTDEPNWARAHSILMPSFTVGAVGAYLPAMGDVLDELVRRWERLNPGESVDVADEMTRLTLETIGLTSFDYRLHSFQRETPHPLVAALSRVLMAVSFESAGLVVDEAALDADLDNMAEIVDRVIRERRARGAAGERVKDLLNAALHGVDKTTGEGLEDENIRYQILTFLIAGHETTSRLLTFAIEHLLRHADARTRARDEVDRVLGSDVHAAPARADVGRLAYVTQVLEETARLTPPIVMFTRRAREVTTLGGRYPIGPEDPLLVFVSALHRDPSVWGDDPDRFDPDRFAPEVRAALPRNAWKPFGTGQRACIGQQFAMQEATLALGKILQAFELTEVAPLEVPTFGPPKPVGLRVEVRARARRDTGAARRAPAAPPRPMEREAPPPTRLHGTPLTVLYGSNYGVAEAYARTIAEDGRARGFDVEIATLDAYAGRVPARGAVVIVASSYNGAPTDDAARFCAWLTEGSLAKDALAGVRYAVFGCGHRDWAATFQAVPKLIDEALAAHGAERLAARGVGDAKDDLDGMFRSWYGPLWAAIATGLHIEAGTAPDAPQGPRYHVELLPEPMPNPFAAAFGARGLRVRENRELHVKEGRRPSPRSARHLELELPAGASYQPGDHLAVLPHNDGALIQRVCGRMRVAADAHVRIRRRTGDKTALPVDAPVPFLLLLAQYVELHDVATRAQIATLAAYTECPPEKASLARLAGDGEDDAEAYRAEVLAKRRSVLDLLEEHPSCALPLEVFLEMLPPLRPRYYSISSSPLVDASSCSITVGVVDADARSGHGRYLGVCSNYLARRPLDSTVFGFVRSPSSPFRPPEDPATPMIMVGPGTGIAPFRGFLQERSVQKAQGRSVGPSLLFFGCRHPKQDFLYDAELKLFAAQGVTQLCCAFSRVEGIPRAYVQDRILEHSDETWDLLQRGAVVYVCGDAAAMAPGVRTAFEDLYRRKTGASAQESEAWLADLVGAKRYVADVWGTG